MKYYVVDAFAEKVFEGNPAGVCVLGQWLPDRLMQDITNENNLAETAFTVKEADSYHLRWFTPGGEVELCGHATLATAYVTVRFVEPGLQQVSFDTLSGRLTVKKEGEWLTMDLPSFVLGPIPVTAELTAALGVTPVEAYLGADLVCVLAEEELVRQVQPDQERIRQMGGLCLHITALGKEYDCVTRTFAPKCNVAEDPVCGRAHCHCGYPLWATRKLGKQVWTAYQASPAGRGAPLPLGRGAYHAQRQSSPVFASRSVDRIDRPLKARRKIA